MRIVKKLKKRKQFYVYLFYIVSLLYVLSFSYFTYSLLNLAGIETFLRIFTIICFAAYFVNFVMSTLINLVERSYAKTVFSSLFSLVFVGIFFVSSLIINTIFNGVLRIGESDYVNYTSYMIQMSDSEFDKNSTIGMIDNIDDIEGYILAEELLSEKKIKNDIEYYSDYDLMLTELYSGKIEAAMVPSNYVMFFNSEEVFENIASETEIVYDYSKEMENSDKAIYTDKDFSEPLTFLILGVDSEDDGLNANASFNGDTLMMLTFNPDTLNATMFSIPRDTLVPIACNNNNYAKINSSAVGGTSCVIDTVQNFTGIDIDYYVKINFKGVVDLVDAVGGVEVYVEPPEIDKYNGQICEQDSDRQFGANLICMDTGDQILDGEQALAYARVRKLYLQSDIARNKHQQDIVISIANKLTTLRSVDQFQGVLDAVSNNIATNMSSTQMLSAYNVFKDILANLSTDGDIITIEKSYLEYYDLRVYNSSTGYYSASLGYYKDSLADIVSSMKVNLQLEDASIIKSFDFTVNDEYTSYVNGKGYTSERYLELLSSQIGNGKETAREYCNSNGLECSFVYVDSDNSNYNSSYGSDIIGGQSISSGVLMNSFSSIIFYINGEIVSSDSSIPSTPNNNDDMVDNVVPEVEEEVQDEIEEEEEILPEIESEDEVDSEEGIDDNIADLIE